MVRATRKLPVVSLVALSLLVLSVEIAKAGDPTWRRFQNSRAYANGYYGNAGTVAIPPSPASGTYRSYSAEPGIAAPPLLQLYYYVEGGYYHYYYAPPRAAAPPAPGAPLPAPATPKTTAK
jgi:hypothetical protein